VHANLGGALEIVLPASSANLGPAFDSAAIALRLHLRVRGQASDWFTITATGYDAEACGQIERNLILDTYRQVCESAGKSPVPLSLKISNGIPLGKGLGSSAAARLAGVALGAHFAKLPWDDDRILSEAAAREQHGDNVAACWLGGVVLVHSNSSGPFSAVRLRSCPNWPLLMAVPDTPLATEQARAVLPAGYSRLETVTNLQRAMLLTAAFAESRPELLTQACADHLHEPYREALCPLLKPLRSLAGEKGILGAVLSGAGPSVLVLLDPLVRAVQTQKKIAGFLRSHGLAAGLLLTSIERRGAQQRRKPRSAPSQSRKSS
jgi:homoserine kinase